MDLRIRRAYAPAGPGEGRRVLVDRLWPRGLPKAALAGAAWVKDVAPSAALRRWFGHDPAKWDEFRRRYFAELDASPGAVAALRAAIGRDRATLLFGARDELRNNAAALREYLLRG